MTTEEKLQHFTSVTIENVQAECDEMVKEYKLKMDEYLQKHKEDTIKNAKLKTSIAEDGIRRKASQEYTSMQMHLKRKINHKNVELKDKLFKEVMKLLEDYVKTEEYKKSVIKKIDEMKKFAEDDALKIILDPKDADLVSKIVKNGDMEIVISDESFIGGVIGQIPSKNILLDDSYLSRLENIREEYTTIGGK